MSRAKDKGYAFVCLTEHDDEMNQKKLNALVLHCQFLSCDDFVLIPGLEIRCMENVHILALGLKKIINRDSVTKVIAAIRSQGAIAILAHPDGSKIPPDLCFNEFQGIEIWNVKKDGRYSPNFKNLKILREKRSELKNIFGYAGNDLHDLHRSLALSVNVCIVQINAKEIISALLRGEFLIRKGKLTINSEGKIYLRSKILVFAIFIGYNILRATARMIKKGLTALGIELPPAIIRLSRKIL